MVQTDITGHKFGRLTAVNFVKKYKKHLYWLFRCDCGQDIIIEKGHAASGHSKSCGCLNNEARAISNRKHGMCYTPEYKAWSSLIFRTTSSNFKESDRYIGRGITVCDSWRNSFEQFYKDMGTRPSLKHSVDRINNDGNYEPSNCRWATRTEQNNNICTNIHITVNEETKTPRQWSDITGIGYTVIRDRVKLGWSPERIITEPVNYKYPSKIKKNESIN
jgi:hypothetical protein